MLRRSEQNKQEIMLDGLKFSHIRHEIYLDGQEIKLTLKEFELIGCVKS
ncbi:response regulator transcription factor [Helicobacter sp. MIT 99-5507]|nr:response regulator transcription factor [Helicobacter sp. MIT 99-5507]